MCSRVAGTGIIVMMGVKHPTEGAHLDHRCTQRQDMIWSLPEIIDQFRT